ncbi:hypothetical protein [Achromobacter spanius]|uniref:hypothetical protein n=1 Tax=Achromobacter spanius TaxID=217203 RepID=UPI003F68F59D
MNDIEVAALRVACRRLAQEALWSEEGPTEAAVVDLAGVFLRLASIQAAGIIESGGDSNIATRAVNYLAYSHVAPSGDDAIWWFPEMLTCLLELAVPTMIQTPESSAFLLDVQKGIAESIGNTER